MAPPAAASEIGVPPQLPAASLNQSASSSGLVLLVKIILRAVTAVLSFISLIILVTASYTIIEGQTFYGVLVYRTIKFDDVVSYRYMLVTIVLGLLYSLLQLALTLFQLTKGNRVSNILIYVDFYGDLVFSYALVTGAAAGFAAAIDIQKTYETLTNRTGTLTTFFDKGNAATSMIFIGSVCLTVSLVLSALDLRR